MPAEKFSPTRAQYLYYRERMLFAEDAREILAQKREVLIMEIMHLVSSLKEASRRMHRLLRKMYTFYQESILLVGRDSLLRIIGSSVSGALTVEAGERSVMGVVLPELASAELPELQWHSPYEGTGYFDELLVILRESVDLLLEYVELKISAVRLAAEIRSTQKRVNALDHVLIPRYRAVLKTIEEVLEEKEREEFVVRKKIKDILERRREG